MSATQVLKKPVVAISKVHGYINSITEPKLPQHRKQRNRRFLIPMSMVASMVSQTRTSATPEALKKTLQIVSGSKKILE